ncbi:MAG: hypothetical protein AB1728_13825 [Bacteroidota bacterium]
MKNMLIIVESEQQLLFFRTFVKGLHELEYHPLFLTNKFSVMLVGKFHFGLDISLLRKGEKNYESYDIEESLEMLLGHVNLKESQILFSAICWHVDLLLQKNIECIWVWGGNTIASKTVKWIAKKNNIRFLLFDRGNSEGKMFVDTKGTALHSWLYEHQEFLTTELNQSESNTVDSYTKHFNFQQKVKLNLFFLLDVLYSAISGIRFVGERNPIKKLFKSLITWDSFGKYEVTKKQFIYIPFAHSFECKKRYDGIDRYFNILDNILADNRYQSNDVVVTIHPLEDDREFVERLQAYALRGEIQLTSIRSTELLRYCSKVYSFNTSVALHAILNNIPIEFVEESLFKGWSSIMAKNYVDRYLIDLPVDEDGCCPAGTVEALFERMRLE